VAGLGPQDLLERRFLGVRLEHVLGDQELHGLRARGLRELRWRGRGGGSAGLDDRRRFGGERLERTDRQRLVARGLGLAKERPQRLPAGRPLRVEVGQDPLHLGVVRVQLEHQLARGDGAGEEPVLREPARRGEVGVDRPWLVAGPGVGVAQPQVRLAVAGRAGAVRRVERGGAGEVSCGHGGSGVGFEPGRIHR
jgi:hypothetical protein